jgi:NAD(P)-dependent dehydrogenase (short-subunit alcohol dehydrogenase family)
MIAEKKKKKSKRVALVTGANRGLGLKLVVS